MSIKVACLECNRVYEIPDAAAGRKGKCECGAILDVPAKDRPSLPIRPPEPVAEELNEAEVDAAVTPEQAYETDLGDSDVLTEDSGAFEPDASPAYTVEPPPLPPPPPPPPPPIESAAPAAAAVPRVVRNYSNLRRCCAVLKVVALIALSLSIISSLSLLFLSIATTLDPISSAASKGQLAALVRLVGRPAFFAALELLAGLITYVLLNAVAEFLYVQMDIEENTRR